MEDIGNLLGDGDGDASEAEYERAYEARGGEDRSVTRDGEDRSVTFASASVAEVAWDASRENQLRERPGAPWRESDAGLSSGSDARRRDDAPPPVGWRWAGEWSISRGPDADADGWSHFDGAGWSARDDVAARATWRRRAWRRKRVRGGDADGVHHREGARRGGRVRGGFGRRVGVSRRRVRRRDGGRRRRRGRSVPRRDARVRVGVFVRSRCGSSVFASRDASTSLRAASVADDDARLQLATPFCVALPPTPPRPCASRRFEPSRISSPPSNLSRRQTPRCFRSSCGRACRGWRETARRAFASRTPRVWRHSPPRARDSSSAQTPATTTRRRTPPRVTPREPSRVTPWVPPSTPPRARRVRRVRRVRPCSPCLRTRTTSRPFAGSFEASCWIISTPDGARRPSTRRRRPCMPRGVEEARCGVRRNRRTARARVRPRARRGSSSRAG